MTKKEKIENTARELFWKHGFKKVSIDEICKKSHVSRKTYYTYYANKSALVICILNKLTSEMMLIYKQIIDSDQSFSEKMNEMLTLKFNMNKDFSMEFVADFFNPDAADILENFNKMVAESMQITKTFFIKAQQKGEMNPELNIDYVMWMMQKQMELCTTPEFMSMFPDAETMTRQISLSIVYGLMPAKQLTV